MDTHRQESARIARADAELLKNMAHELTAYARGLEYGADIDGPDITGQQIHLAHGARRIVLAMAHRI